MFVEVRREKLVGVAFLPLFSALISKKCAIFLKIPDHAYKALIIEGSGSGKINPLFNLVNNQSNFDKIYLYVKDPYEAKYQLLIKRKRVGLKHCNDSKAVIEYSNDVNDIYENIDE